MLVRGDDPPYPPRGSLAVGVLFVGRLPSPWGAVRWAASLAVGCCSLGGFPRCSGWTWAVCPLRGGWAWAGCRLGGGWGTPRVVGPDKPDRWSPTGGAAPLGGGPQEPGAGNRSRGGDPMEGGPGQRCAEWKEWRSCAVLPGRRVPSGRLLAGCAACLHLGTISMVDQGLVVDWGYRNARDQPLSPDPPQWPDLGRATPAERHWRACRRRRRFWRTPRLRLGGTARWRAGFTGGAGGALGVGGEGGESGGGVAIGVVGGIMGGTGFAFCIPSRVKCSEVPNWGR